MAIFSLLQHIVINFEEVVENETAVLVAMVASNSFDSNFVKPIDVDDIAVGCSCRPEMKHVVVNCRCMMEIVVETIVDVAAAHDFAKNCSFVVLVVAFGNSKDLEFVVDFAKNAFVAVGFVVVEVVIDFVDIGVDGVNDAVCVVIVVARVVCC